MFQSRDETPLALALGKSLSHLAEQLLQSGADVNLTDHEGRTPLHVALLDGNIPSALFLLQHGGDINLRYQYRVFSASSGHYGFSVFYI